MLTSYRRKRNKGFSPWHGFLILLVLGFAFGLKIVDALRPEQAPTASVPAVAYEEVVNEDKSLTMPQPVTESIEEKSEVELPIEVPTDSPVLAKEFNLAVPFTSQAPTGNWDTLHEDTCEEAAFLMVAEFYEGRIAGKMEAAYADPIMIAMVDLQTQLGMGYSISAQESLEFIKRYYNLNTTIVDNPTVEQIKQLVAEGKPVIVPVAGRELGNPFFTGEGPLYHMFVIRGYTETTFITNEPGTRMGENYAYDIDVVMEAIGDWNNGDPYTGAKRIFYIEPV